MGQTDGTAIDRPAVGDVSRNVLRRITDSAVAVAGSSNSDQGIARTDDLFDRHFFLNDLWRGLGTGC